MKKLSVFKKRDKICDKIDCFKNLQVVQKSFKNWLQKRYFTLGVFWIYQNNY